MTNRATMARLALVAAALLATIDVAAAETLRMGGTGAASGLLPQLFAAFDPGAATKLEIIPSLGHGGAMRALTDDLIDVAIGGRVLNSDEKAKGLTSVLAIRTPYVMVTSHPRPNGLKSAEIANIFITGTATWIDGTPIRVILRPQGDTDIPILNAAFPGMIEALEQARQRREIPVAATDQDNTGLAERMPGSLTGSTLTQIKTENRRLRLVALDGIDPTLEALEQGSYPFGKTLYFVVTERNNALAQRFLAFLRSPKGQDALRANGCLLVAG